MACFLGFDGVKGYINNYPLCICVSRIHPPLLLSAWSCGMLGDPDEIEVNLVFWVKRVDGKTPDKCLMTWKGQTSRVPRGEAGSDCSMGASYTLWMKIIMVLHQSFFFVVSYSQSKRLFFLRWPNATFVSWVNLCHLTFVILWLI